MAFQPSRPGNVRLPGVCPSHTCDRIRRHHQKGCHTARRAAYWPAALSAQLVHAASAATAVAAAPAAAAASAAAFAAKAALEKAGGEDTHPATSLGSLQGLPRLARGPCRGPLRTARRASLAPRLALGWAERALARLADAGEKPEARTPVPAALGHSLPPSEESPPQTAHRKRRRLRRRRRGGCPHLHTDQRDGSKQHEG